MKTAATERSQVSTSCATRCSLSVIHAQAADGRGVLSHRFNGPDTLWDVRLNGEPASEARFNAAVAGQYRVPVGLITGDDVICAETCSWLPGVEAAVVRCAIDRYTARCLPQATAQPHTNGCMLRSATDR